MNAHIVPQDNGLFSIIVDGQLMEYDMTHAEALASMNVYLECAWEVVYE